MWLSLMRSALRRLHKYREYSTRTRTRRSLPSSLPFILPSQLPPAANSSKAVAK